MRYQVRWSNGFWKLFDVQQYRSVAMFRLAAHAEEAAWEMNFNPTQEAP